MALKIEGIEKGIKRTEMKIKLQHIKPETASSDEKWVAHISIKDSYTISDLTEIQYNAYKYLESQLKEVKEENLQLRGLLGECACPHCNGSGIIQISEDEIEQCQWCGIKNQIEK
jgi:hypothetical protein